MDAVTENTSVPVGSGGLPTAQRRAASSRLPGRPSGHRFWALLLAVAVMAVVVSLDSLHGWLLSFLPTAESIIRDRPVWGALIFVLAAASSAMMAFLSSAVVVPVGVYVWGKAITVVLLWLGWILGGVCAYSISCYLGRPVVRAVGAWPGLAGYESRLSQRTSFGMILLLQLALPSEVPGYLLGLVRYPLWKYLGAMALAELPYAVATVYLGASFIERQTYLLVAVGLGVGTLSGLALFALHRRVSDTKPQSE